MHFEGNLLFPRLQVGARRGVISASVSLAERRGRFEYDPAQVSPEEVREYVEDAGFDASLQMPEDKGSDQADKTKRSCMVAVGGMTCQSCVKSIESALRDAPGVRSIRVSLEEETAFAEFDPRETDAETIRTAIYDCGFDADLVAEAQVEVEGMTCQSCVKTIEGGLKEEEAVKWAKVSLEEKLARVRFLPVKTTAEKLAEKVYEMGFETKVRTVIGLEEEKEVKKTAGKGKGKKKPDKEVVIKEEDRPPEDKEGEDEEDDLERCFISVRGMTCASCVAAIEKHVKKLDGVHSILVALMAAKAEVRYDPARVMPHQIANSISELGFPSEVIEGGPDGSSNGRVELRIKGMTCASCVHLIESTLMKKPGVTAASVALATQRGRFEFDPHRLGPRDVIRAVKDLGFEASLHSREVGSSTAYLNHQVSSAVAL